MAPGLGRSSGEQRGGPFPNLLIFLCLVFMSFLVTGCGDSSGGNSGSLVLQVGDLSAADVTYYSSHEIALSVELSTNEPLVNLPVTFYLLNSADLDTAVADGDVAQHELGSCVVVTLDPGTEAYDCTLTIPADVPSGSYHIVAVADPGGALKTAANSVTNPFASKGTDLDAHSALVLIDAIKTSEPDIVLTRFEANEGVVVFPDTAGADLGMVGAQIDTEDVHLSATVGVRVSGSEIVSGAEITLCVDVPGDSCYPLDVWDSATADYQIEQKYLSGPLTPGEEASIHLGLSFPDAARVAVAASPETHFNVIARVELPLSLVENEPGILSNSGDDNTRTLLLAILSAGQAAPAAAKASLALAALAAPAAVGSSSLYFSRDYSKGFSSDVFGASVDFTAFGSLTSTGLRGEVEGNADASVFGNNFTFLDTLMYTNVHTNGVPYMHMSMEFAGLTIYTKGLHGERNWNTHASYAKKKGFQSDFWIGIVPVTVEAGASGTLGYLSTIDMQLTSLNSYIEPYVSVGTYATAEINLLAASGGITADLDLIYAYVQGHADGSFTMPTTSSLSGTLTEKITSGIHGPNGKIDLFAKYPDGIDWCHSWGVPYPCGIKDHTATINLVSWQPYIRTDVLLNQTETSSFSW